MSKEDTVKVVATKMSVPFWRRFKRVLTKLNLSEYSFFQNCADVLVRNGDDRHNLTPEMEQAMSVFEHCEGWDKNFNLADPTTHPEITEATYYIRDKEKKGTRAVHVEQPFFGHWTQDFNVQHILEKFLCLTFPKLYLRLRFIAGCKDCESILELLTKIVTEMEADENKREFLKPFEDAERSEWGKTPLTQPYKIKHRRNVDEMEGLDLFAEQEHEDMGSDEEELDFEDQIITP